MKIILSRKGFDSTFGGYPSPILKDGRLISLPIPLISDKIKYSDLKLDEFRTYYDLMKELKPKIKYDKKWHELTQDTKCHLDPDLSKEILQRDAGWKPCFGQMKQSQLHLVNEDVKKGDLFLFFGWFKKTILKNGILQFDKSTSDLHVLFGYLQIGDIMNNNAKIPNWMKSYPHVSEDRKKIVTNTIYVSRENLTWNKDISGAGVFNFDEKLVLTKKGFSRSKWDLPDFFKNVKISRHSKSSWKDEGYFKSVDIGQEFVIEDNKDVENWAKSLIERFKK